MSQQTNIASAFLRLTTATNTLSGRVGTLSSLSTTEKSSLVAALNEIKSSIGAAGVQINDLETATGTTWSSSKIQSKITEAISALINGAPGAMDTLKEVADQIAALAQADAGLVSFSTAQTLTAQQQAQCCSNIGIGDPAHDFIPAIESALISGL